MSAGRKGNTIPAAVGQCVATRYRTETQVRAVSASLPESAEVAVDRSNGFRRPSEVVVREMFVC